MAKQMIISFGMFLLLWYHVRASTLTAMSGVNFQMPVLRTDLFGQFLDPTAPIIMRPSLVNYPGLPDWLKFIQPQDSSDGFLYGTPEVSNVGDVRLEILALNSKTYESTRILRDISVQKNMESPLYLATFFISNQNLADLLETQMQQDFLTAVTSAWGQGSNVIVHSLVSAKDLGRRVPLNPEPDQKFGAQVTVGSQVTSDSLTSAIADAASPCQQGQAYTPSEINGFFQPTFIIDWCTVTLTPASSSQPPPVNESAVYLGGEYDPPAFTVEESDRFVEFMLVLVLPCAIVFVFILILGYLMCCARGARKDRHLASEVQLAHHRTLRQASRDLRTMSNRRDGTASVATVTPIGTPTVASQRPHIRSRGYDDHPWTSTPQINHRGMATPPPYRTPPHPHKHHETSFSNQASDKRRLSEPSNARGEALSPIRPAPPFMGSTASDRLPQPRNA